MTSNTSSLNCQIHIKQIDTIRVCVCYKNANIELTSRDDKIADVTFYYKNNTADKIKAALNLVFKNLIF